MMASVKGLYRFAFNEGLLSHDPTISLRPVRRPRSLPKPLAQESMAQLLDSVMSDDYSGLRDRAILEFLYGTGARVSEVVGLRLGDLDWIEETALLHGKGGKQRLVPLGREVTRSLRSYLQSGRILISTDTHDRVFLNKRGGPLSRQGIDAIIRKRALAAGIPALGLSAHVFRHSCATHMLEHGADIRVVQELLGHASIATTQLYTAVSIPTLRRDYLAAHPRASK
jgi:integrase/recombinase XerD